MLKLMERYVAFKANPENDGKKDTHFCQEQDIQYRDFLKVKEQHPNWAREALDMRRTAYAEKMTSIDTALFAAATAGDTKAAELIYKRFDAWSPKQADQYHNFAELVKEAAKDEQNRA